MKLAETDRKYWIDRATKWAHNCAQTNDEWWNSCLGSVAFVKLFIWTWTSKIVRLIVIHLVKCVIEIGVRVFVSVSVVTCFFFCLFILFCDVIGSDSSIFDYAENCSHVTFNRESERNWKATVIDNKANGLTLNQIEKKKDFANLKVQGRKENAYTYQLFMKRHDRREVKKNQQQQTMFLTTKSTTAWCRETTKNTTWYAICVCVWRMHSFKV